MSPTIKQFLAVLTEHTTSGELLWKKCHSRDGNTELAAQLEFSPDRACSHQTARNLHVQMSCATNSEYRLVLREGDCRVFDEAWSASAVHGEVLRLFERALKATRDVPQAVVGWLDAGNTDSLRDVEGWFDSCVSPILRRLSRAQEDALGAIVEIGVHHGKSLIPLIRLRNDGEVVVAIDCWENQQFNRDRSGNGDFVRFCDNLRNAGINPKDIVTVSSDSLQMNGADILSLTKGMSVRLFSIDGCHTPEATYHDLVTARDSIGPKGVIMMDDVFNPDWPGVASGLARFLGADRTIIPFAHIGGRTFLCRDHAVPLLRSVAYNLCRR